MQWIWKIASQPWKVLTLAILAYKSPEICSVLLLVLSHFGLYVYTLSFWMRTVYSAEPGKSLIIKQNWHCTINNWLVQHHRSLVVYQHWCWFQTNWLSLGADHQEAYNGITLPTSYKWCKHYWQIYIRPIKQQLFLIETCRLIKINLVLVYNFL